jgi:hypothetical protein
MSAARDRLASQHRFAGTCIQLVFKRLLMNRWFWNRSAEGRTSSARIA